MKKTRAVLAALSIGGLIGLLPASANASGLEVRIGGMFPRANSILFEDTFSLYMVEKKDFVGAFGGIEFTKTAAPHIELSLSVDGYGREIPTNYRDYTRPSGSEIEQSVRLLIVPTSAILRVVPGGRYQTLTPYLGAGLAAMFWKYEEFGDFIDFGDRGRPVIFDSFESKGTTLGLVLNAGLRYRINEDFQVVADYRRFSAKQTMGGDFSPNEIDLSSDAFTLGFRLSF